MLAYVHYLKFDLTTIYLFTIIVSLFPTVNQLVATSTHFTIGVWAKLYTIAEILLLISSFNFVLKASSETVFLMGLFGENVQTIFHVF